MCSFNKLLLCVTGLTSAAAAHYGDGRITKTITSTTTICPYVPPTTKVCTSVPPTNTNTTPTTTTLPPSSCIPTSFLYTNAFDVQFFPTPYIRLNYSPNFQVTTGRGIQPRYEGDQYGMIVPQSEPLTITIFIPFGTPADDPRWYFDAYFLRVGCVDTPECTIRFTGTKVGGGTEVSDLVYESERNEGQLMVVGLTDDDMHDPGTGPWGGLKELTIGLAPGQSLGPDARVVVDDLNYLWTGCTIDEGP